MPYKQSRNENGSSHKYINSTWYGGVLNETLRKKKNGNIVLLKTHLFLLSFYKICIELLNWR